MPFVHYAAPFFTPTPKLVPAETPAVRAAGYVHLDEEAGDPGGITAGGVRAGDVRPLGTFEAGAEVYVQGVPGDVLDDTDDTTAAATRIWWRGVVVSGGGGDAADA